MCIDCYENEGSPTIATPTVIAAAGFVRTLNEITLNGGRLHIVTEDWNLEDHHLDFCLKEIDAAESAAGRYVPAVLKIERRALNALLPLSVPERASALALAAGYFEVDGTNGNTSEPEATPP